jgi:hypothetical protein
MTLLIPIEMITFKIINNDLRVNGMNYVFLEEKDCILSELIVETKNSSHRLFVPFEISFHAFLAAEVKDIAGNSFLNSRCLWNIRLTMGILDKFFRLRLPVHPFFGWENISEEI